MKSKKVGKAKSKAASKPQTKSKAKPKTKIQAKAKSPLKKVLKAVAKTAAKVVAKAKPSAKAKTAPVKAAPSKKAAPAAKASAAPAKAKGATKDLVGVFTPLDDRILIVRDAFATRTPGGLYIPDSVSTNDRPSQGRVVAVGRGHRDKKGKLRPLDVQLGDSVMYQAYSGSEITLSNETFVVLREQEIIAVMK